MNKNSKRSVTGTKLRTLSGLFCTVLALPCLAATTSADGPAGKGPLRPGSSEKVVIDRDYLLPLRHEPEKWFHDAASQFRRNMESEAATELRKAEMWLYVAAASAPPNTKLSLQTAAKSLKLVADNLAAETAVKPRDFDHAVAVAGHALAKWHYFLAEEKAAKEELGNSAEHLRAAARFLRNAANSTRYEYGDTFDELMGLDPAKTGQDVLARNLSAIKGEIGLFAGELESMAKKK